MNTIFDTGIVSTIVPDSINISVFASPVLAISLVEALTVNGNSTFAAIAGETLSGHMVVTMSAAKQVVKANTDIIMAIAGITANAALQGSPVTIYRPGLITEPSWSWIPGQPVYMGTNGVLTQTPPHIGVCLIMGYAIAPDAMIYEDTHPIILAP